jgi:hypothetical protein
MDWIYYEMRFPPQSGLYSLTFYHFLGHWIITQLKDDMEVVK